MRLIAPEDTTLQNGKEQLPTVSPLGGGGVYIHMEQEYKASVNQHISSTDYVPGTW